MQKWICKYCGGDTSNTDMDYLVDYDHLSCILESIDEAKKPKVMKIKNWDKINGYTYKGYAIVNPAYGVGNQGKHYADVLNLNLPQKPKWTLELTLDKNNTLVLTDTNGFSIQNLVELVDIRTPGLFRVRFEEIIDEMLKVQLISAPTPNSHSMGNAYNKQINPNYYGTINVTSGQSGILNTITANSNTVTWAPSTSTNLPNEMLIAIKDLQQQIDQLNYKLNPPSNPF